MSNIIKNLLAKNIPSKIFHNAKNLLLYFERPRAYKDRAASSGNAPAVLSLRCGSVRDGAAVGA